MAPTEDNESTAVLDAEAPAAEAPAKPKRAPRKKKEAVAEEAQRLAEATPPGAASSGAQDRPTAAPQ
jgi:hypothetical protein